MKTHNGLLIGSGFAASVFAFGIASGAISFKDASIASLVGIPAALISHTLTDSKAQKRINQADERVKRLERELESALSKTAFLEDIEARSQHLSEEIDKVRSALDLAISEHQKASDLNLYLQQTVTTLQANLEASQGRVEELQAECEVWEEEFSDRVSREADAHFQ
jgi:TolA-binding protein